MHTACLPIIHGRFLLPQLRSLSSWSIHVNTRYTRRPTVDNYARNFQFGHAQERDTSSKQREKSLFLQSFRFSSFSSVGLPKTIFIYTIWELVSRTSRRAAPRETFLAKSKVTRGPEGRSLSTRARGEGGIPPTAASVHRLATRPHSTGRASWREPPAETPQLTPKHNEGREHSESNGRNRAKFNYKLKSPFPTSDRFLIFHQHI